MKQIIVDGATDAQYVMEQMNGELWLKLSDLPKLYVKPHNVRLIIENLSDAAV